MKSRLLCVVSLALLLILPVSGDAGVLDAVCAFGGLLRRSMIRLEAKSVELIPVSADHPVQPTDPYDRVGIIPMGKFKGQAIDTSVKRPARIIYESNEEILFANFQDGGKFHQAHVRKDGIDSVYFRINRFPSGFRDVTPAHTLLYFEMKPGSEVVLEAAGNIPDLSHPHGVREFVFSIDYVAPKGVTYELLGGFQPNYLTVMDFSSAYDYSLRGADPNFPVQYLKLNLSEADKRELLVNAVHRSDERGYNFVYDVVHYNCTTALFDLLDDTLKYPSRIKAFVPSLTSKDPVAGPSEEGLIRRGLIGKNPDGSLPSIWAGPTGVLPH